MKKAALRRGEHRQAIDLNGKSMLHRCAGGRMKPARLVSILKRVSLECETMY
jgi:hypothetical protein